MNNTQLIGRLTKDPYIGQTANGKKYAFFTIAVNDGKTADGKDIVDFIECVAYEKRADLLETYFHKGDRIGVSGKIKTRAKEVDGKKSTLTTIQVDQLDFLNDKPKEDKPKEEFNTGSKKVVNDDDLPF